MYLRQLRKIVGRGMSYLSHPDMCITREEADVHSIVKLLNDDWTNHFVCISAGTMAPLGVARDILYAHTCGMAAYEEFKRDRIEDERPKAQFHDKIAKKKHLSKEAFRKIRQTKYVEGLYTYGKG